MLVGHAQLARLIATPICLDESITSARVAREAIELGACSVVCIKPGRVGGYLEATHVHERAGALLHRHVRRMRKGITYFAKRHKPKWRG